MSAGFKMHKYIAALLTGLLPAMMLHPLPSAMLSISLSAMALHLYVRYDSISLSARTVSLYLL